MATKRQSRLHEFYERVLALYVVDGQCDIAQNDGPSPEPHPTRRESPPRTGASARGDGGDEDGQPGALAARDRQWCAMEAEFAAGVRDGLAAVGGMLESGTVEPAKFTEACEWAGAVIRTYLFYAFDPVGQALCGLRGSIVPLVRVDNLFRGTFRIPEVCGVIGQMAGRLGLDERPACALAVSDANDTRDHRRLGRGALGLLGQAKLRLAQPSVAAMRESVSLLPGSAPPAAPARPQEEDWVTMEDFFRWAGGERVKKAKGPETWRLGSVEAKTVKGILRAYGLDTARAKPGTGTKKGNPRLWPRSYLSEKLARLKPTN